MTNKKILGIILIVLFIIGFTLGFTFMGVIYGGYTFGIALLIPLGVYAALALAGALIYFIIYLFNE